MQDRINTERKLKREDQRRWQNWILLAVRLGIVGSALLGAVTTELALWELRQKVKPVGNNAVDI